MMTLVAAKLGEFCPIKEEREGGWEGEPEFLYSVLPDPEARGHPLHVAAGWRSPPSGAGIRGGRGKNFYICY